MKRLSFFAGSRSNFMDFPAIVRRKAGFQLDRVQRGIEPDDWKPMTTIGSGVKEIRIRETSGAYRIIYVASFAEAVFVLHAFQKKSQKTAASDLDLATTRFKDLSRSFKK